MCASQDDDQDDIHDKDADVDADECQELDARFFENAILNRPGDVLVSTVHAFRKKHKLS